MGGQGSGRPPNVVKRYAEQKTPIATNGEMMFLPNNSGVSNWLEEGRADKIVTNELESSQIECNKILVTQNSDEYGVEVTINELATQNPGIKFNHPTGGYTIMYQDVSGNFMVRNNATGKFSINTDGYTEQLVCQADGKVYLGEGNLVVDENLIVNARGIVVDNDDGSDTAFVFRADGGTTGTKRAGFKYVSAATDDASEFQYYALTDAGVFANNMIKFDRLGNFEAEGEVKGASLNAENGWSGTFTNGDGDTVTVTNGIITDVS